MGYLRPNQIHEIENEKRVIERTLETRVVQERGNLIAHLGRIDKQIESQSPPDLTPEERDQKTKECKEIEGRLVPMMPSDEEMRRNPPGVVGRHVRFEKMAKSKDYFPEGDIFRWKDNQLALHKGDEDPDVANFERMRPMHNMGGMLGAQIPGQQYFGTNPTPAYREGYEKTFGEEVTSIEAPEPLSAPPRKARKRNGSAKKRAPNKNPPKMTALACGKLMGPSGRHFHVKHCTTCQEAAEES